MPIVTPLASPFASNATTATNESVTGQNFPMAAGHTYKGTWWVPVSVAATTTGVELALDLPAGATVLGINNYIPSIAAVGTDNVQAGTGTDDVGPVATDTAVTAGTLMRVDFMVKCGSTAGDCQLRIDTDAAAAATVLAGCYCEYRDLLSS